MVAVYQILLSLCIGLSEIFYPNGDGYNDHWNIENLRSLPKSTITIFNRYGKLLKEISPTSGMECTFNGHPLTADYWFNLTFEDGKS
jgi:gliding motility-associated-like protein